MFKHSKGMEVGFSLPAAQRNHGRRGQPSEEALGCLLSPCVASSRRLMLVEHLELICRPTNSSSASGGTPAAFVMSNTWHKSFCCCCLQLPSHFSAGTF